MRWIDSQRFRDSWPEVSGHVQNSRAPLAVFVVVDKRFQVHTARRRLRDRLSEPAGKKSPTSPHIRVRRTLSQAKDSCGQTRSRCLRLGKEALSRYAPRLCEECS